MCLWYSPGLSKYFVRLEYFDVDHTLYDNIKKEIILHVLYMDYASGC